MKQYGNGMKATEFSRKQIGVVYAKAKKGELKVEKWYMCHLYTMADFYSYDENGSAEKEEAFIKQILDAVFAGDTAKAQGIINDETAHRFDLLSSKNKKAADRSMVA